MQMEHFICASVAQHMIGVVARLRNLDRNTCAEMISLTRVLSIPSRELFPVNFLFKNDHFEALPSSSSSGAYPLKLGRYTRLDESPIKYRHHAKQQHHVLVELVRERDGHCRALN